MPRVTSKDVARAAGVSQTTVSFVLNGRDEHGISDETRQHVVDMARRLGYVPSAAARALRAGRSEVVVCLVPDLPVSEAFEVMKRQLSAAMGRDGYTCVFLEMANVAGGDLSTVWKHIDPAAVISFAALSDIDAEALRSADVPVLDDVLQPDGAQLEGLDQREIGYLQVQHLASRGHRVIGFAAIADPRETPFCRPRIAGARQACRELGLTEPAVAVVDYSPAIARDAVLAWRASDAPITAVAAFNDLVAIAILGVCRTEGITVPDDLAVIGVDDLPAANLVVPALSTVSMDLSIPARNLAVQVLALIRGEPTAGLVHNSEVLRLVERQSVQPALLTAIESLAPECGKAIPAGDDSTMKPGKKIGPV
ncbi:LacI family DNA-binding transcriptional regulator [Nocardia sp. NPDC050175]|uniref:LacI family DNA-binding transcriptional regulator n=1 Tax=Nocardia sp. NPDC050175 TaxID=3364317 RepID=UPI0037A8780C